MVDGGGLENRWTKVSRVRILLPPPDKIKRQGQDIIYWVRPVCTGRPAVAGRILLPPPEHKKQILSKKLDEMFLNSYRPETKSAERWLSGRKRSPAKRLYAL